MRHLVAHGVLAHDLEDPDSTVGAEECPVLFPRGHAAQLLGPGESEAGLHVLVAARVAAHLKRSGRL